MLAERVEELRTAGEHLVNVRLVACVEDDAVARRVEDPMHRDRDLDDAEVGTKMAAGARHGADEAVADLRTEAVEVGVAEILEVLRP